MSLSSLIEKLPPHISTERYGGLKGFLTITTRAQQYLGHDNNWKTWKWRAGYSTHEVDECRSIWDETGNVEIAGYGSTPEIAVRRLVVKLRRFKFIRR